MHLPRERTGVFSWVGHTWRSWYALLVSRNAGIADHFLWNFPQVPPVGKKGGRFEASRPRADQTVAASSRRADAWTISTSSGG